MPILFLGNLEPIGKTGYLFSFIISLYNPCSGVKLDMDERSVKLLIKGKK